MISLANNLIDKSEKRCPLVSHCITTPAFTQRFLPLTVFNVYRNRIPYNILRRIDICSDQIQNTDLPPLSPLDNHDCQIVMLNSAAGEGLDIQKEHIENLLGGVFRRGKRLLRAG